MIGYLGGKQQGLRGRIKDFVCLESTLETQQPHSKVVVGAASDGIIRLWFVKDEELRDACRSAEKSLPNGHAVALNDGTEIEASRIENGQDSEKSCLGHLLGSYETGNRITCMTAFWLQQAQGKHQDQSCEEEEEEFGGFDSSSSE